MAKKFINEGYLEASSFESELHSLHIPELKAILLKAGPVARGKKQELIDSILSSISESESGIKIDHDMFYISEKGKTAIKNYELQKKNKQFALDKQCVQLISENKISEAYHKLCLHIVLSPQKPGLGIDWVNELENGLSQRPYELNLLYELLEYSDVATDFLLFDDKKLFNSCVIYVYLSGEALRKTVKLFEQIKGISFDTESAKKLSLYANYLFSIINSRRSISEFIEDGILKYEVLCCDNACEICQKASKTPHLCKKAVVGKNLPPFHKECRCTIAALIP